MSTSRFAGVIRRAIVSFVCVHCYWIGPVATAAESARKPADLAGDSSSGTGAISGRLIDDSTGMYLKNARVVLAGTQYDAITDRGGTFIIRQIPAGQYHVVGQFTGYDPVPQDVSIAKDRETIVELKMVAGSSIVNLDKFIVTAYRRADADELMQRRNVTNLIDVASSKEFGEITDGTLSGFIQRIPGMTGGSGMRGVQAQFNQVHVDGEAYATPGSNTGTRTVQINAIPSSQVDRIEVTKTLTPDIEGGSVGGRINLITKSPFERQKGRSTSFAIASSLSPGMRDPKPGYTVNFSQSDILGKEKRIGYTFSFNNNVNVRHEQDMVTSYLNNTNTVGVPIGGPAPLNTYNPVQTWSRNTLKGGGLKLEFKAGDHATLFANSLFQRAFSFANARSFTITTSRNILAFDTAGQFWYAPTRVRAGQGNVSGRVPEYNTDGTVKTAGAGGQGGVLPNYTALVNTFLDSTVSYNQSVDAEYKDTYAFQVGGNYNGLRNTKIDFRSSYSFGRYADMGTPADLGSFTLSFPGSNFVIDRTTNFYNPDVTWIGGTNPTNVSAANSNTLTLADLVTAEQNMGFRANAEHAVRTVYPITLKSGFSVSRQKRNVDNNTASYVYTQKDFARFASAEKPMYAWGYQTSAVPDATVAHSLLLQSPNLWTTNATQAATGSTQNDNRFSEEIAGAYVMGTGRFNRLTVLSGVRTEWTWFDALGHMSDSALSGTPNQFQRRKQNGYYQDWFPNLQLRYELGAGMVIRSSWSTGIGRPDLKWVIPSGSIDRVNHSISATNSELRPQYTQNIDFAIEKYIEPAGLIAINVFRKSIKDFQFNALETIRPGMGYAPEFEGWDLSTQENGGFAWVKGAEFDYRQQLTFLPGWLAGFGVYANMTLLKTEANYTTPDNSTTSDIQGFTPRFVNWTISYSHPKFALRLSSLTKGQFLQTWNVNPEIYRFRTAHTTYSIRATVPIGRGLTLFAGASGIFQGTTIKDTVIFIKRPNQPLQVQLGTPGYQAGIRGEF